MKLFKNQPSSVPSQGHVVTIRQIKQWDLGSSGSIRTRYGLHSPGIEPKQIPLNERSKARVRSKSLAGIPGLNSARGMDVCVVRVV